MVKFTVFRKPTAETPRDDVAATSQSPVEEGEADISITHVVAAVFAGWWIIGLVLVAAIAIALYQIKTATPLYTAEAAIVPTERPTVNAPQTGTGVAALLGLAVGGGSSDRFGLFADILASYSLAQRLQDKYGLLQVIYASRWDEATESWIVPPPRKLDSLREWLGLTPEQPPSVRRLKSYLSNVEFDSGSGQLLGDRPSQVTMVTFEHGDPEFARWFLQTVLQEADELLRENERERAQAQIKYIEQQLATTSTEVSREVLLSLLQVQYRKLTVAANEGSSYIEMFDPVLVSEQPTYPQPRSIIQTAVVIGLALGIVAALVFRFRRVAFGRRAGRVVRYTS